MTEWEEIQALQEIARAAGVDKTDPLVQRMTELEDILGDRISKAMSQAISDEIDKDIINTMIGMSKS